MFLQLEGEGGSVEWAGSSDVKRRHFLIEGQTLKLFGRRGKTYKGHVNLLAVTEFKPSTDATAPAGALELYVRASQRKTQRCILVPDHSADDLFLGLGNAVPSHATDAELWRKHMGSRAMAPPSESVPREYRMGKTLGTGTFGKVKLAQRADGALFALKCLNRHRIVLACQSGRLGKEIRLLKMLNHPNVIRLHEVLHTPTEILMVMEYVEGGDLLEVLNTRPRFQESEVRHIFCQICSGVSFCHSLGVAHRDLKPENVLIGRRAGGASNSYQIKVADFGLSTLMKPDELLSTACGSPHYVAPEILHFDGGGRYDGKCSDVWSLGVILHVMLCYKLPFEAESTQLLYKKIRQGLPSLPSHLSVSASSLVRGMLEVDAAARLTLAQVGQQEWPQLQAIAPNLYSQTVDAVVGCTTSLTQDGSQLNLLSASNLFALGADAEATAACASVRRAYTFDALPTGGADSGTDEHDAAGDQLDAAGRLERGLSRPTSEWLRKHPRSSPLASPLGVSPRDAAASEAANALTAGVGTSGDSSSSNSSSGGRALVELPPLADGPAPPPVVPVAPREFSARELSFVQLASPVQAGAAA